MVEDENEYKVVQMEAIPIKDIAATKWFMTHTLNVALRTSIVERTGDACIYPRSLRVLQLVTK